MLKDIKYTGINTASNAYDAPAGQLAVAHNVVNERGYIETLAPPAQVVNYEDYQLSGYKCVFRHDMLSGTSNYIFYKPGTSVGSLQWLSVIPGAHGTEVTWITGSPVQTSIKDEENLFEITAVGNTLCVLTATGMDYFVWKNGTYKELGTNIPNARIEFALKHHTILSDEKELDESLLFPIDDSGSGTHDRIVNIPDEMQSGITNAIMGEVSELADEGRRDGYIGSPFYVRYALRLFDGSLVKHSAPVLMCPSLPTKVEPWVGMEKDVMPLTTDVCFKSYVVYYVCAELFAKMATYNLADWQDIVTGIELYISNPASRLDQDGKIKQILNCRSDSPTEANSHKYSSYDISVLDGYGIDNLSDVIGSITPHSPELLLHHAIMPEKTNYQLETDSIFYRVKEFTLDEISDYSDFKAVDLGEKLPTLTVQPTMQDDYNSHNILIPGGAYAYNQRINLFGVSRKVWFDQALSTFLQYFTPASQYDTAVAYVRLEQNGEEKWITSGSWSLSTNSTGNIRYFFYPDTHAKQVLISINGSSSNVLSLTLKEHPSLNGAYWYGDPITPGEEDLPTPEDVIIAELNKVYTSEVGNPFYFPIGGINTIGTGKILALASNVRAISQGQFGEYPLYVFTDSGIWMMEVDDKGLYKAKQPMSLDVIKPGSKVTSVDNAVAYVIERGLMLVSGSETRCISEVLDGKPEEMPDLLGGIISTSMVRWETYKDGVSCAYDEAHQRLHVYNPGYDYHYVYSVRTGLWTTEDDVSPLLSTLNGKYVNTALGLLDMSLNDDNGDYRIQTILTRPINFETDAYKRLRDNIQRGDIDLLRVGNTRNISVLVQATDDLLNWHDIAAVTRHYRIVRKSGTPHKWFRWKIVIGSSPEEYRLHGLTADIDVTGNNKLR
jgi:hypothetical protein